MNAQHLTRGLIAGLLVMTAIPAAAATATSAEGQTQRQTAKAERQVCVYDEGLGSRTRKKVCMSQAEFEREKKAGNIE